SPEQVLGQDVDGRADLYAVGVVLYRMLTANLPFSGDNALAVARQHVAQEPTPPHVHRQDLPDWCGPILQRALAKSPADRFQPAEEFRDALRNATGMTAAELNQAFTITIHMPEMKPTSRPTPRTRTLPSGARRRRGATQTVVVDEPDRTLSLFREVVRRRTRDVVPKSRRAFLMGSLAAAILPVSAVPTLVRPRRPSAPEVPAVPP